MEMDRRIQWAPLIVTNRKSLDFLLNDALTFCRLTFGVDKVNLCLIFFQVYYASKTLSSTAMPSLGSIFVANTLSLDLALWYSSFFLL